MIAGIYKREHTEERFHISEDACHWSSHVVVTYNGAELQYQLNTGGPLSKYVVNDESIYTATWSIHILSQGNWYVHLKEIRTWHATFEHEDDQFIGFKAKMITLDMESGEIDTEDQYWARIRREG